MDVDWVNTRKRFDSSPYALCLGMKLVELTTGYAKVELKLKDEFRNWDGRIQGGVIVSLLDQAFGAALNTLDRVYVAVQLNVNFLTAPEGDTIYAESTVLHRGKSLGVSEMVVTDSGGRLIARGLGTTIAIGDRGDTSSIQR
ncbi:MAG: PaaI family thioesterase [Dehalococcoidia bacterium]